ncbi:MAG: hypothetical protein ACLUPF_08410 [Dorea sp.]
MYKSNADEEEIIKCFHCGNETIMKKVGEYSWGSRDLKYSDFDFFISVRCLPAQFVIIKLLW